MSSECRTRPLRRIGPFKMIKYSTVQLKYSISTHTLRRPTATPMLHIKYTTPAVAAPSPPGNALHFAAPSDSYARSTYIKYTYTNKVVVVVVVPFSPL